MSYYITIRVRIQGSYVLKGNLLYKQLSVLGKVGGRTEIFFKV